LGQTISLKVMPGGAPMTRASGSGRTMAAPRSTDVVTVARCARSVVLAGVTIEPCDLGMKVRTTGFRCATAGRLAMTRKRAVSIVRNSDAIIRLSSGNMNEKLQCDQQLPYCDIRCFASS
jgi:hypothetical protein